ncbi:hypothetical protein V2J09_022767, partial [Rumex salicifolius]
PGRVRAVSVLRVSRVFHPNFCAKWRSEGEEGTESKKVEEEGQTRFVSISEGDWLSNEHKHFLDENSEEFVKLKDELESKNKPTTFSTIRVNQLLQELEGKLLSYKMFARDTKASRNVGPPTECFIYHARAAEASLPCLDHKGATKIMCIELVANRFLRKVRIPFRFLPKDITLMFQVKSYLFIRFYVSALMKKNKISCIVLKCLSSIVD